MYPSVGAKKMLIFLYRLVVFLCTFLFLCVPIMFLGVILLLLYLPFSSSPQLPFFLRWWDCADFYVGRDTSTYLSVISKGWWSRYTWLAFRNPMNYFDYNYLGLHIQYPCTFTRYMPGEEDVNNNNKQGLRHIELINGDKKTYFEYFYIKAYKIPFVSQYKCIRFRMGWKIQDLDNQNHSVVQWVLTFNPINPFTGTL